MSRKKLNLGDEEIAAMFAGEVAAKYPPILSPSQFAQLLGKSRKTIYHWLAQGRLDGACCKRGKHVFILRDRAIAAIFNGKVWKDD